MGDGVTPRLPGEGRRMLLTLAPARCRSLRLTELELAGSDAVPAQCGRGRGLVSWAAAAESSPLGAESQLWGQKCTSGRQQACPAGLREEQGCASQLLVGLAVPGLPWPARASPRSLLLSPRVFPHVSQSAFSSS